MNRYRPLLAALLFAALGASPAAYLDGVIGSGTRADGGMLGSGTRTKGDASFFDGGYLGSGNKSDEGDGGTSFLDENRGGYFGSGN